MKLQVVSTIAFSILKSIRQLKLHLSSVKNIMQINGIDAVFYEDSHYSDQALKDTHKMLVKTH